MRRPQILRNALVLTSLIFITVGGSVHADDQKGKFWGSVKSSPKAGIFVAKSIEKPPALVTKVYPSAQFNFYSMDLDGDGKPDFIVESKKEQKTCFVKSDLSIKHCDKINLSTDDGFAYMFFVKLASSGMMSLMNLSGDEDRSDYFLQQFDPKTWALDKGIPLYPMILAKSSGGIYWGYPWDITGLSSKTENGVAKIQAGFDPKIFAKLEMDSGPERGGVFVLFEGAPTQDDPTAYDRMKQIGKFKYMSLEEILSSAKSAKPTGRANRAN